MPDISEKRMMIANWLKSAGESEIDALLQTIELPEKGFYPEEIICELDNRWLNYVSGKSPSFTINEVSEKLLNRKK